MNAAFFAIECYAREDDEAHYSAASVILYSESPEATAAGADTLFERYRAARKTHCERVRTTGPLGVYESLQTAAGQTPIDWAALGERSLRELALRPASAATESRLAGLHKHKKAAGFSELVRARKERLLGALRDAARASLADAPPGPTFLFMGSGFNQDRRERIPPICLIEATDLQSATLCSLILNWPFPTPTLTEWCCPILRAGAA